MNLKPLSNQKLITELKALVNNERAITTQILHFLLEVESRLLFAELGHSSLYNFCMKELGYCQASAHLRISAMRLLKKLPERELKETESKLQSGTLTLTNLAMVQIHLNQEQKTSGIKTTPNETIELLKKVESKSTREAEKILLEKTPEILPREQMKAVSQTQTQITFTVNDRVIEKLQRVKSVRAHTGSHQNNAELFEVLLDFYLQHKDPVLRAKRNIHKYNRSHSVLTQPKENQHQDELISNSSSRNASVKNMNFFQNNSTATTAHLYSTPNVDVRNTNHQNFSSTNPTKSFQKNHAHGFGKKADIQSRTRFTPAAVKHVVTLRDSGCCTYIDPQSGVRCNSNYGLEFDHIQAFAQGGTNTAENLRLRCKAHNTLHALNTYGRVFTDKKDSLVPEKK